jgi:large subunit ribosomal protein L21
MYAVIRDRSRQHKVKAGDRILLDLDKTLEKGAEVVFNEVCLIGGDSPKVGTPLVAGATVVGEVLEMVKGPKLEIGKFKRRKNYRRRAGHRAQYTQVQIKEIRG